jgi:hypothetical protein
MSQPDSAPRNTAIAFFISPHGFGHAARTSAIMAALRELNPEIRFEIFTSVPREFFASSVPGQFNYHPVVTDIGFVQASPLRQDLEETLRRLDDFLPFRPIHLTELGQHVRSLGCRLIVCDIAPLGIAVAEKAGLPSVLIENFTWDWLYRPYVDTVPGLTRHISYLSALFESADYHIQLEPVCRPVSCDLITRPVSRAPRTPARSIQEALRIPRETRMVTISMGGVRGSYGFLERLRARQDIRFVIPGASETIEFRDNQLLLPQHSDFFHPDLINAADALVGKVGYSTLAEVYYAGIPFGYVPRPNFPESESLIAYLREYCNGIEITATDFETGDWIARLSELLQMPRLQRGKENGAVQAAAFICNLI